MLSEDKVAVEPTRSLADTSTPLKEEDALIMSWNARYSFPAPFRVTRLSPGDQM